MMPLTQIRAPSTSVALPVLSRLQDDDRRYGRFLLEGQVALGLILVVTLGLVAGAADPVVALFLGETWSESAPVLALLALAAGLRTLSFVAYWVFLSRALTRQLLYFSVFAALLQDRPGDRWRAVRRGGSCRRGCRGISDRVATVVVVPVTTHGHSVEWAAARGPASHG